MLNGENGVPIAKLAPKMERNREISNESCVEKINKLKSNIVFARD